MPRRLRAPRRCARPCPRPRRAAPGRPRWRCRADRSCRGPPPPACGGRAGSRPPTRLGVELVAQPAHPAADQETAERGHRARADRARDGVAHEARGAFEHLEGHVAGEAVRDHHVGAGARQVEALDVADEVEPPDSSMRSRAASTWGVPLPDSSPTDRRPTRGRSSPYTASMKQAPMYANCTRCSGRASTLAPASRRSTGPPGIGSSTASAGRCTPRRRLIAGLRRPASGRCCRRTRARRRARRPPPVRRGRSMPPASI